MLIHESKFQGSSQRGKGRGGGGGGGGGNHPLFNFFLARTLVTGDMQGVGEGRLVRFCINNFQGASTFSRGEEYSLPP